MLKIPSPLRQSASSVIDMNEWALVLSEWVRRSEE